MLSLCNTQVSFIIPIIMGTMQSKRKLNLPCVNKPTQQSDLSTTINWRKSSR
ncbi:MAG UNVERIFIED_CONTAM: hypothetical protein LVQ98_02060 [Rickettsiaceae bacterium]